MVMWEWCRFFFKRLKIQIFLWRVKWKKKVQPKSWELYFIWQKLGGLKSRRQVPQINLGELLLGGKGRSRFIKKFCNKEQVVWMLKDCCKLKKTKYQVNEFRAFFFSVWEDARVWDHWILSFCMYLSSLGPVSCVFTFWVSSGFDLGE